LLEQCKRMVDAELRRSGISIRIGTSPDLPPVLGNRTQIQQVILNLIRNGTDSINASGRGDGSIRIGAAFDAKSGTVKVSVRDNGPGVPEESRAMLFMPLNSTKAGGLGLGLSLCRSILLAHGGDIWLASTGPTGAVFMFTLKPAPQARA
jgi:signal transduction histidine kinase